MKRVALALALVLSVLASEPGFVFRAAAAEVPLLKELRKPVEKKEEVEDEDPVTPSAVLPERRLAEPSRLLPEGAVWYMGVPDADRLAAQCLDSPLGKFWNEPFLAATLRNNRFGLKFLFADLPASVVTPERIGSLAACLDLAGAFAPTAKKMASAGYFDENGNLSVVFMFDVGLDRNPAFETLIGWETSLYIGNPGTAVERGDHAGSFIDVWTLRGSNDQSQAVIAGGFIENMAIVSNNRELAMRCMELASGGSSLASSSWGQRLEASIPTSSSAHVVGYLRMDALLKGLESSPIAHSAVSAWADYVGHAGRDGEAIYYGMQFTPEGTRETFLLPAPGQSASPSLMDVLAKRLKPGKKWTTPNILPYQPNPTMFLAGQMDGKQLGSLLRQERRLFGVSKDEEYFTIPAVARRLFTNDVINLLTGEIGLAFYPEKIVEDEEEETSPATWLMILPCSENPEKSLPKAEFAFDRAGATIMSRNSSVANQPCWAVISSSVFRRAGGHHLVIASHGDLLISTVDQLLANSSFSSNKDFVRALSQAESEPGFLFYVNLPDIMVREYPNMSAIMRRLYPRSSGFNSRPPLSIMRRYVRGVLGAIAPAGAGDPFTRVTVQAPAPTLAALAAGMVLRFPSSLREQGRLSMFASRDNLQTLWMRLQLYSSRYGHFPDTLDDLLGSMRTDMSSNEIRDVFTASAALSRLSPSEAMTGSYAYMSGITPNDEPDLPIIIEAQPWSEDFQGMFPYGTNRMPSQTGDFIPYRQFIRLDGETITVPEKYFQEKILPRLLERE